jgi:acetate kinase
MGFSALDGLPMGTRCGQVDPGVLLYLMDQEGMTAAEISDLLYKPVGASGPVGPVERHAHAGSRRHVRAAEAIDYFVFRIQRELGGLAAALGGIDALVFCGGIGENSRTIRARMARAWAGSGSKSTRTQCRQRACDLARRGARPVMVIPTDEEGGDRARDAGAAVEAGRMAA